jgi:hypothetical protein
MDFSRFKKSLAGDAPPEGLSLAVQALWWDAKGRWNMAHQCAQADENKHGAWVHAYLHRKEGDAANAAYWYRRAGSRPPATSLDEEWQQIARALIEGA